MALINHAKKEINAKIVYFGPSGSGKSTALQYIFSRIKPSLRGELKNVPAGADNLLFFDFSPFEVPLHNGYRVRLHVYTLTGQATNPATWKMTLKGADGLIIMVDASPDRISDVQKSISQLKEFLSVYGVGLHDTPAVLQLNSFESEQVFFDREQYTASMDLSDLPCCLSNASSGKGVLEALTTLSQIILSHVAEKDHHSDDSVAKPVAASDGILESPEDLSMESAQDVYGFDVAETPAKSLTTVSLACEGTIVEGKTLRIPLEISCGSASRRLIVTVSVDPE